MTNLPARIDALSRKLASCTEYFQVKPIRDAAKVLSRMTRGKKELRKEHNRCGSIVIDAGVLIAEKRNAEGKAKGTRGQLAGVKPGKRGKRGSIAGGAKIRPPAKEAPTTAELELTKQESARMSALAKIPKEDRDAIVALLDARGNSVTEESVLREYKMRKKEIEIAARRALHDANAEKGGTVESLEAIIAAGDRFPVIYADPPWEFKVWATQGTGTAGGLAENHYRTRPLSEIKALPVSGLAAKDCVLFLWCVMPELPGALEVINAWGFEYKTMAFVWVKQNRGGEGLFTGMGYWTRANAEMCLLATRGNPQRVDNSVHQVIISPLGRHSEKPEEARKRIERLVTGPYLELFGRREAQGWKVWGDEVASDTNTNKAAA